MVIIFHYEILNFNIDPHYKMFDPLKIFKI